MILFQCLKLMLELVNNLERVFLVLGAFTFGSVNLVHFIDVILEFRYFGLEFLPDHHHLLHHLGLLVDLFLLHPHFIETYQRCVLLKLALYSQKIILAREILQRRLKLINSDSILLQTYIRKQVLLVVQKIASAVIQHLYFLE